MNKHFLFLAFLLLFCVGSVRGQLKIFDKSQPSDTKLPHADAVLELDSKLKGLLFSRVALVDLTNSAPLQQHVAGMMVYNTSDNSAVSPGIYYNTGSRWIAVGGAQATTNIQYDSGLYTISFLDATGNTVKIDLVDAIQKNQSLTKLEVIKEEIPGEGPSAVIEVSTLHYTDEKGNITSLDLRSLVEAGETLTSLSYDGELHQLIYIDEAGVKHSFNMVDLVGDTETLTILSLDVDRKRLQYKDENNLVTQLDLSPIIQEPWYSTTTNVGATSNDDDLYTKGWVGIGINEKSTAVNEKLRVNGAITTVNSYYADYVFEDYFDGASAIKLDYKFKTLYEVEDFVKTHRHLPGITPINELSRTEDGYLFNVSELSIQLLEKTEELYLHVIDQQKMLLGQKDLLQEQDAIITNQKQVLTTQQQQIKDVAAENVALKERVSKLETFIFQKK